MTKYNVTVDWQGYSRGYTVYEVEAENAEEASDEWWRGLEIERETVRDDTEKEFSSVEEA